jgi:glycosyltransferase involved in cell wall biosynthesis
MSLHMPRARPVENPFGHLFLVSDRHSWVLAEEAREICQLARHCGIAADVAVSAEGIHSQSVFFVDRYGAFPLLERGTDNRLALSFFHGMPGTGYPEFDGMFDCLRRRHDRLWRIQVTHSAMQQAILETGISPEKVHLIRIGIDAALFRPSSADERLRTRAHLGIPVDALVVGSFQKDGNGWGAGDTPKLIKGPDVFLQVIDILRRDTPRLLVLLSGPARGFVKTGLERMGVAFRHVMPQDYRAVAECFQALDVYLVTARQEGGPKGVLESMASGVPLVTTRVGQAMDLVCHGENGWITDPDRPEELAYWARHVLASASDIPAVVAAARQTAEANAYEEQLPLWRAFFAGFVETPGTVA